MKTSVLLNRMSSPFVGILLGRTIGAGDTFNIVLISFITVLVLSSFAASRFEG